MKESFKFPLNIGICYYFFLLIYFQIKILDKKLEVVQTNIECIIKPVLTLPDILDLFRLSTFALNYFILDAAISNFIIQSLKLEKNDSFTESLSFFSDLSSCTIQISTRRCIQKRQKYVDILLQRFCGEN